jgi:hypothetical protein
MATADAHTAGTVYQLGREPFLAVVLGHAASHRLLRLWPKRDWPSTPRGAAARGRLPPAAGPTVTSGPGMESEP